MSTRKYEVEVSFIVRADDEDDAVRKTRALLSRVKVRLEDGLDTFFTYDGCAKEWDESDTPPDS